MSGVNGYNFTASTRAVASQVNQNFEWFRGHYLPITQSGTWANTTGVMDLGSTTQRWRNVFANGYNQQNGETLRILRGVVQGAATITAGTGFSITNTSAGLYTISFTAHFLSTPALLLTSLFDPGSTVKIAMGGAPSIASWNVRISETSATLTNGDFSFVAIGPA